MVIQLKAKDFKNSRWIEGETCPLACAIRVAIKKYYGQDVHVNERGKHVIIGTSGTRYNHKHYSHLHYRWDKIRAFFFSYGEIVLREITIEGFPPVQKSDKTPLEVVRELEGKRELWIRY